MIGQYGAVFRGSVVGIEILKIKRVEGVHPQLTTHAKVSEKYFEKSVSVLKPNRIILRKLATLLKKSLRLDFKELDVF